MDPLQLIGSLTAILALSLLVWLLNRRYAPLTENRVRAAFARSYPDLDIEWVVIDDAQNCAVLFTSGGWAAVQRIGDGCVCRTLTHGHTPKQQGARLMINTGDFTAPDFCFVAASEAEASDLMQRLSERQPAAEGLAHAH